MLALGFAELADLAQLVEQRIRNAQVTCSNHVIGSNEASADAFDSASSTGDAGVREDGGILLDAMPLADGAPTSDAAPGTHTFAVSPEDGGSISVSVDSTSIGSCAATTVCTYVIVEGTVVSLTSNFGTLRHSSWTGACAWYGVNTGCFLMMDQDYQARAMYDASYADCP